MVINNHVEEGDEGGEGAWGAPGRSWEGTVARV